MTGLKDCDAVFKGGVASGLVYARAAIRLKARFRFRGLAGASAGGIAATLIATAEFARQGGDEQGFTRLEDQAEAMPGLLRDLFQASPPFRALLKATVALAPGSGQANYGEALACFAPTLLIGAAALMSLVALTYTAMGVVDWWWTVPAFVEAAVFGAVAVFFAHWAWVIILAATKYNFGICSGMGEGRPAVTQWMHAAIQHIAGTDSPLTFGDLGGQGIDLRLISSNLSFARPFVLPDFEQPLWFDPEVWRRLFPADVMAVLEAHGGSPGLWRLPDAPDLPVLVPLRMSIACPGLLEQVPVYLTPEPAPDRRLYFSDGGLTQNFPFDLFDGELRPAIAIDLETLTPDADDSRRCWHIADEATWGMAPFTRLPGPLAFCWSLFRSMREGRIRAAIRRPGKVHIFRIGLKSTEGGMNLSMSPAQVDAVMAHGDAAGDFIISYMEGR